VSLLKVQTFGFEIYRLELQRDSDAVRLSPGALGDAWKTPMINEQLAQYQRGWMCAQPAADGAQVRV
jgi:hypothetical protein